MFLKKKITRSNKLAVLLWKLDWFLNWSQHLLAASFVHKVSESWCLKTKLIRQAIVLMNGPISNIRSQFTWFMRFAVNIRHILFSTTEKLYKIVLMLFSNCFRLEDGSFLINRREHFFFVVCSFICSPVRGEGEN